MLSRKLQHTGSSLSAEGARILVILWSNLIAFGSLSGNRGWVGAGDADDACCLFTHRSPVLIGRTCRVHHERIFLKSIEEGRGTNGNREVQQQQ